MDGRYSNELDLKEGNPAPVFFKPVVSHDRPHIYFFKILDCNKEVAEKFGHESPRIRSKWEITSKDSWDYEADNDNAS